MATLTDFRRLDTWNAAYDLTLVVYRATASFPPDEALSLTHAIRRSAAGMPTVIAEACGSGSNTQLKSAVKQARSGAYALLSQLMLATDLGYLETAESERLQDATRRLARQLTQFNATLSSKKKSRSSG